MITRDELHKIQKEKSESTESPTITVGMGSCSTASGSQDVIDAIKNELKINGLNDVIVRQTGCIGMCSTEPNIQVKIPGMPTIMYGNVNPESAKKIILKHVMKKKLVNKLIYDNPAE